MPRPPVSFFFFFNDTATTEIYTLSLHDALPIWSRFFPSMLSPERASIPWSWLPPKALSRSLLFLTRVLMTTDRKSTRLNSSHGYISYAVFCLKKKKNQLEAPGADAGTQATCDVT